MVSNRLDYGNNSKYFENYKFLLGKGVEPYLLDIFSTELILVVHGSARVVLCNKEYHLMPETVILANAGDARFIYPADENVVVLVLRDTEYHVNSDKNTAMKRFSSNFIDDSEDKIKLIAAMGKLYLSDQPKSIDENARIIYLELIQSIIEKYEEINNTNKDLEIAHDMVDYISNHHMEDISLVSLGERFNFSAHYISKFFKNHTGMGVLEYLHRFRVHISVLDLIFTEKNIMHIAEDTGFNSARNMNRVYLKYALATPREIRNYFRRGDERYKRVRPEDSNGLKIFKKWLDSISFVHENIDIEHRFETIYHDVKLKNNISKSEPLWSGIGSFAMSGYDFHIGDTKLLDGLFSNLKYKMIRFHIAFDNRGIPNLKMDINSFIELSYSTTMSLISLVERNNIIPIITFDIFSLVGYNLENMSNDKLLSDAKKILEKYFLSLLSIVGIGRMVNWWFDFAMPQFLTQIDDPGFLDKLYKFLLGIVENFRKMTGYDAFNKGIFFGDIPVDDLRKVELVMRFFEKENFIPSYISMNIIDEDRNYEAFNSMNCKVNQCGDKIERFIRSLALVKRLSDVDVLVNNICIHFELMSLPAEYRSAFVNAVSIETSVRYLNVAYINSGTMVNHLEDKIRTVHTIPFTKEGFKTPYYYSLFQLRNFDGETIYSKERCIVQQKREDFNILVYTDIHSSMIMAYKGCSIGTPLENVKIKLNGLRGKYKVTINRINVENGNVDI